MTQQPRLNRLRYHLYHGQVQYNGRSQWEWIRSDVTVSLAQNA